MCGPESGTGKLFQAALGPRRHLQHIAHRSDILRRGPIALQLSPVVVLVHLRIDQLFLGRSDLFMMHYACGDACIREGI